MRAGIRYLWALTAFGLGVGTLYYVLTSEWTGTLLFWFGGLMPLIVAAWATRRGLVNAPRASDDPGADLGASEGESLGSFPVASAWPVFLVLGAMLLGVALIYGLILLPAAFALIGWAAVGFVRESRG